MGLLGTATTRLCCFALLMAHFHGSFSLAASCELAPDWPAGFPPPTGLAAAVKLPQHFSSESSRCCQKLLFARNRRAALHPPHHRRMPNMSSSSSFRLDHFLAGWIGGECVSMLLAAVNLGCLHVCLLQMYFNSSSVVFFFFALFLNVLLLSPVLNCKITRL